MYDAASGSTLTPDSPARHSARPASRVARPARSPWNRRNPFPATVIANTVLSGEGSAKEVRHIELSLADSGITYEPGDGIGIVPINDPALVDAVLGRLGADGEEVLTDRKGSFTFREALSRRFEIARPSRYLVATIAERTRHPELSRLVDAGDTPALEAWLHGHDVLDLLELDPSVQFTTEEFVAELAPLAHREYSISSSPTVHPGTVHITMATVRYTLGERDRGGVCSTHLADRCAPGAQVGVFISPNKTFRLPADEAPVIMIGPGTGIAPFRAFLHHRAAAGASGRNWLFFGDQHRSCDYLYSEELERFVGEGLLDRLDLAFSRDQDHKVYVQDRIREHGAELYSWLQDGATVYVCGDATTMADDVDAALHEVVAENGGMGVDGAREYVAALRADGRYLRDVY